MDLMGNQYGEALLLSGLLIRMLVIQDTEGTQ